MNERRTSPRFAVRMAGTAYHPAFGYVPIETINISSTGILFAAAAFWPDNTYCYVCLSSSVLNMSLRVRIIRMAKRGSPRNVYATRIDAITESDQQKINNLVLKLRRNQLPDDMKPFSWKHSAAAK